MEASYVNLTMTAIVHRIPEETAMKIGAKAELLRLCGADWKSAYLNDVIRYSPLTEARGLPL